MWCAQTAGFTPFPGEAREVASLATLLSGYPLSDIVINGLQRLGDALKLGLRFGNSDALKDAAYLLVFAVSGYVQWFVLVPRLLALVLRLLKLTSTPGSDTN